MPDNRVNIWDDSQCEYAGRFQASGEAPDLSSWMQAPHRLAVDAKGYVWRAYEDEDYWSMAPVNPDNSPIPQPVTYYVPDPYANRPKGVSYEHGETAMDIRRNRQDPLRKLWWCLLLARRGLGLRTVWRRVVSQPQRIGEVRPAWWIRWHTIAPRRGRPRLWWLPRGLTLVAPYPGAKTLCVDLVTVRWAKRGRGVHPLWNWIEMVANA